MFHDILQFLINTASSMVSGERVNTVANSRTMLALKVTTLQSKCHVINDASNN